MAKTKDGMLILGKREREAIEVIINHTKTDLSYGREGTFIIDKEAKQAFIGIDLLKFILQITMYNK